LIKGCVDSKGGYLSILRIVGSEKGNSMNIFVMSIIGLLGCQRVNAGEPAGPRVTPPSSPTEERSSHSSIEHQPSYERDNKYNDHKHNVCNMLSARLQRLSAWQHQLQGGSLPSAPCQNAFQVRVKECMKMRAPWFVGATCIASLPSNLNYYTGKSEVLGRPLQRVISGIGCIGMLVSGGLAATELFNAWIDLRVCNATRETVAALRNMNTILQEVALQNQKEEFANIKDEIETMARQIDSLIEAHQKRLSEHNQAQRQAIKNKCTQHKKETDQLAKWIVDHQEALELLEKPSETSTTAYQTFLEKQKKLTLALKNFLDDSATLMEQLQSNETYAK
jgi:hypothetical protein